MTSRTMTNPRHPGASPTDASTSCSRATRRSATGAEWARQRETNTSNFEASRLNRGYYAQLLAGTSDTWLLTVGARVDDNEKFGTFTTGRAAGSWRFASGTRVRGSVGTAFKEPAFSEVFNTSFTRGNPSLEPERSRSLELSVEQEFLAGRATSAVTWFDQRFRDRVDFIAFPPDSAVFGTFANIGEATATGVELEARTTTRLGHRPRRLVHVPRDRDHAG